MVYPDETFVGWITHAYVARVIDGDTVDLEVRKKIRIRLEDVRASELRDKNQNERIKADAEYLYLSKMIAGKKVTLAIRTDPEDELKDILTLNRVVGRIYYEGKDINEEMQKYIDDLNFGIAVSGNP